MGYDLHCGFSVKEPVISCIAALEADPMKTVSVSACMAALENTIPQQPKIRI